MPVPASLTPAVPTVNTARSAAGRAAAAASPVRGAAATETRETRGPAKAGATGDDAVARANPSAAASAAIQPAAPNDSGAGRGASADAGRSTTPDQPALARIGAESGTSSTTSASTTASAGSGASAPEAAPALPRFAEHLQAAQAASPVAAPRGPEGSAPSAHAHLAPALASPDFPPALGAQVSLFARHGVERATIEISPPEMGPISVQISLDGNAARVDFLADAAATRQVIEQALPTLASSLRESGLTLTGGGVFQQPQSSAGQPGQGGSGQPGAGHPGGRAAHGADDGLNTGPATVLRTTAQRGLVDLVA
jgi:flagellar hook-length control protein FliK